MQIYQVIKTKLTAVWSRVGSLNKLFVSFLMRFILVPLTRMDRNRADVDDKTMAISSDSRTPETMRGRKCRAHCALSVRPTNARRIPGARGALYFKTIARKQIRMVHVARISRLTVCLRVGYVGVNLYVDDPFLRIHRAYFPRPMSTGVSSSSSPKGAQAHRQLRHFIARVTCRAWN